MSAPTQEYVHRLEEVEGQFGTRPRIPMAHGETLYARHFRAETDDGTKFVYCPIGFIASWNIGDYDNKWCHWCGKGFEEMR